MQTESGIEISTGQLTEIVQSVFETAMNLSPVRVETPWFPSSSRLTAAVHLTGEWNGVVVFECDGMQARMLAGRYLFVDPPATVDSVVRDVLGEIANMIGGNLKSVLARGVRLSMPSVVEGSNYVLQICRARLLMRVSFQDAEGPFWVTVLTTRS